jgi:sugar/nucleoside kinase (ribokinase family)
MDIVCVGDCGIDHYLPSGDRYFGGITANFARHAQHEFPAGDAIRIVSCVGDDEGADLVLSSLADSAIDCHVSRLTGQTPVQYIETKPDGEKNFVRYDEGVLRDFKFTDEQRRVIASCDLLVAPVFLQIVGLFDELMSINTEGLVAIDFADFLQHPDFDFLNRHIDEIDIGFFGLTSNDQDTIEQVRLLAEKHSKLFVVTLGADGSRAFHGAASFACDAIPVSEVIDTTGAGDAFAAGFLSRYCHDNNIPRAMQRGAVLAAQIVGQVGSHYIERQIKGV